MIPRSLLRGESFHDRIYGACDIKEPVLIELIHSQPLVRLKKINQAGASQYLFPWKNVTRFEHSLGVLFLLRQFGASVNQQIAGLLHDVPHTAFSHVADFVFANRNHEFHELFHESIIRKSDVVAILKKHKIPRTVIHPEKFGLLERPIPDLCADRIDYALRDHFAWKKDHVSISAKLGGLKVHQGEFVFDNPYSAEAFATDYLTMDQKVWGDLREAAMYEMLAQAIQHAMEKRLLTLTDLFTDDETVLNLLRQKGDAFIRKKLNYLTPHVRIEAATRGNYHLFIKTKVRYVDPKILAGGHIKRLSEMSRKYKRLLDEHITHGLQGSYMYVYPHRHG